MTMMDCSSEKEKSVRQKNNLRNGKMNQETAPELIKRIEVMTIS